MKKNHLLLRFAVLVTAMMCALGAAAAEAYANYTSSNATLTFYYDDLRSSRPGTTYDLNTSGYGPGWESDGTNANVAKVVFDPSFADARPTTTCYWFFEMENLQYIQGMRYLNTSQVTDMSWMFSYCHQLNVIDVAGFNTAKVTNMRGMFSACWNLQGLDLSSFNTSKVTDMTDMFFSCGSLQTIYVLDGWTTAAVTSSTDMFAYCSDLVGGQGTTYDENHVDKAYAHIDGGTSNPGYFTRDPNSPEPYACYTPSNTTLTFYYDNQRSSRTGTTYDLNTGSNDAGWDTDGTKSNVTKVVFDPSFTGARPTTTYDWFYYMQNLESITGLNYLNTSEVTNMDWMFLGCGKLTSLDFSSFNTSKVTSMYHMFDGCVKLQTIYVGSGWSTAAVTSSSEMFNFCPRLVGGQGTTWDIDNPKDKTYAHIDGGTSNPGYFTEWKEAYACYTPSNTTLTFYYDNYRSSRTGTTYDLNTGNYSPGWRDDGSNANVTKVVFDPSFADARPTTCHSWFRDMAQLQTIYGLNYLNTSAVTHMVSMFRGCSSLTVLDLSSFSTANVIAMGGMFMGCSNLRTIYAGSGWSTAAVEASAGMFSSCTSLVGGQGTTFNSSHVGIDYAHIDGGPSNPGYFTEKWPEAYACYTPSNTTLTFYYDTQRSSRTGTTYDLNEGDNITGWESDGTNASVTKVVFDSSFAGARPTTTSGWFYDMWKLESITGMSYLNTSEVTNMSLMFYNCIKLTSLDVSHFNTSNVTDMNQMFGNCTVLTSLDLSHFNTSKVTDMGAIFRNCNSLTSLDLSSFNTSQVAYMTNMFTYCSNLQTITVGSDWSTAAVTSSTNMFNNCTSLVGGQGTTYDANHVDKTYAHIDGGPSNPGYFTEKGPEAYACYTPSNTTLTFYYDNQRSSRTGTTYDLNTDDNRPGWDTDGTKTSVTKVVFDPSFANARPTTTYGWFYYMQNLQSITGLSYLNTSEVTNMAGMFNSCFKLTSLDLSSFNTSKVTDMRAMFFNSNYLRTIYVGSGWSTAAVTYSDDMFWNCTSLVGGMGTTYDENHIDGAYARIDGGTSNPGYFTAKNAGLRGDVNGDGSVNIADVTALINYLLSHNATGLNLQNANCNQDSTINISDVTALINYLLSHSW